MKRALPIAVLVAVLDQLTKEWALARLQDEPNGTIDLPFGAQFQLHYNTGAAFSSATSIGPIIGLVAMGMVVLLLRLSHTRQDRFGQYVLGAICGGAVGNLLDRIFRGNPVNGSDGPLSGAVVDYIKPVDFFAVFNVADAAIVVGVIAVVAQALFFPPAEVNASVDHETKGETSGGGTTETGIENKAETDDLDVVAHDVDEPLERSDTDPGSVIGASGSSDGSVSGE